MKKVLLRLFIVFCLSTSILLVAPFHIAYAEGDIIPASQFNTNNIIGSQITYNTEYYETTGQYDQYDNTIEFILDDYYIGKIDSLTVTYRYIGNSTDRTISFTNVGVNGTSFTVTIANTGDRVSTANLRITTLRYDGQFYTKSSFLQVFPFESFAIQSFNLCNNQLVGINNQYQYQFNMFKLIGTTSSQYVTASKMHQFYGYAGTQYTWIFWIDKNVYDNTTFFQYVTLGNNLAFVDIKVIDRFHFEGHTTSIVNVTLQGINNAGNTPSYRGDTDALYMPIYFNLKAYQNVSTDFALQFGLDNRLLNALDEVAGTTSSDNSAAELQNEQSEFGQSASELYQYENDFNESLNDSLDDINVNFDIGNTFGSKFLASATWVRQQFDALTSSSPFGSVLSFSLVLGIALLVIGKAIK